MLTSHCNYPGTDELCSEEFLTCFFGSFAYDLIVAKDAQKKIASIGQVVMQAVLLAPLQVGLGVQLHHHYASRFLINTLYKAIPMKFPVRNFN